MAEAKPRTGDVFYTRGGWSRTNSLQVTARGWFDVAGWLGWGPR